jgi:sialate O-acetylesterase
MVLQREPQAAKIWGWSTKNANVTVDLNEGDFVGFVIADPNDGSWSYSFPPQPAGVGHTIKVSDDGGSSIQLDDIAFGDVFLCSGQSNMELSVPGVFDAEKEIEDSINYPHLRLATAARTEAATPQTDVPSKTNYTWARSGPSAVDGKTAFAYYSATCYFFGRELYKSFDGKIPIGLVTSCWGGQTVEVFSSADALADTSCGGTRPTNRVAVGDLFRAEQWRRDTLLDYTDITSDGFEVQTDPSSLWNGMIHPLLPMRFSGAIWYQGEANAKNAASYACRFPAMITDWRQKFDLPDLSFVYVQLAGYSDGETWAYVRAAQDAALQLPKVGMAVAIDIGDPDSPNGAIHPRRKQEVGRRVALTVRSIQYKERGGLVHTGPKLTSVQFAGQPMNHMIATLGFEPGTADGLHLNGAAGCTSCCAIPPFEAMDSSGSWSRVIANKIHNEESVVLLASSPKIYGIRYGWEPAPECILYNGQGGPDDHLGLPAAPFEWCAYPSGNSTWTGEVCKTGDLSQGEATH